MRTDSCKSTQNQHTHTKTFHVINEKKKQIHSVNIYVFSVP